MLSMTSVVSSRVRRNREENICLILYSEGNVGSASLLSLLTSSISGNSNRSKLLGFHVSNAAQTELSHVLFFRFVLSCGVVIQSLKQSGKRFGFVRR